MWAWVGAWRSRIEKKRLSSSQCIWSVRSLSRSCYSIVLCRKLAFIQSREVYLLAITLCFVICAVMLVQGKRRRFVTVFLVQVHINLQTSKSMHKSAQKCTIFTFKIHFFWGPRSHPLCAPSIRPLYSQYLWIRRWLVVLVSRSRIVIIILIICQFIICRNMARVTM